MMLKCIIFPRNVFLRNRFLTVQRNWKTRRTIPPCPHCCPFTASPRCLGEPKDQTDQGFTFEWGLKCCYANTIDSDLFCFLIRSRTNVKNIMLAHQLLDKVAPSQQPSTRHVSNLVHARRPQSLPPFVSISHGLSSFFEFGLKLCNIGPAWGSLGF